MADKADAPKPQRFLIVMAATTILALIILVAVIFVRDRRQAVVASRTASPPQVQGVPGAPTDQHLAKLEREENAKEAQVATQQGGSFVPVVSGGNQGAQGHVNRSEGSLASADMDPADPGDPDLTALTLIDTHPRKRKVVRDDPNLDTTSPRVTEAPAPRRDDNGVEAEMKMLLAAGPVPQQVVVVQQQSISPRTQAQGGGAPKSPIAPTPAGPVHPGDILYAVLETALDSDQPGPVLATVMSGPIKGAKTLGEFERKNDALVVRFTKLVLTSGKTVSIDAYGVDPSTSKAAIATYVNTHFWSRWGALVAASFLDGFGQAVQQSGSTTAATLGPGGTSTLVASPAFGLRQQSEIALGKVGQTASRQIEKNFSQPPTVRAAAGTPIGVLIIGGGTT